MDEDANANIYEDLPDFRYDITLDRLNASIAKLEAENHVLQSRLVRVIEEKRVLEANCCVLNTNISSLLKTAKLEIKRKERTIIELREQLNKVVPRKKQFGLKRRRESSVTPSPRKRPRFSPRKSREDRPHSREDRHQLRVDRLESSKKDMRSNSKPRVVGISSRDDKVAADETPTHVEKERRDRLASEKENEPLKEAAFVIEPRSSRNCAAPSGNLADPNPAIAAPSLPTLHCPTLFSSRMYKRLYGKDPVSKIVAGDSGPPSDPIQLAIADEPPKPPKLLKSDGPSSPRKGPSHQPSSCSHVTPEDIKIYLELDDSLKSYSSLSSSPIQFECKPVATSYVKPQNCNGATFSKATRTDLEPRKSDEPPCTKLEVPISQPPAVELPSIRSIPQDKTKSISSKVNVEQCSAKPSVDKVGFLAVGKSRHQAVASIPPVQKLAAQVASTVVEKLDKTNLVVHKPDPSIENPPESKTTETNASVRIAEKSNRNLKIPRLSGSAKGRSVRQVFAPISNQWNYSVPNSDNKSDSDKKGTSELSVVKAVSVTSELTVRVDDLKQDELNTQFLFGSPVKWADDSLDSPITEGPAKSRKLYSIFGSPCIDKSNSSEHPFSVPPGAYEESCWTSQICEKVPTKPPAVEADLQRQRSPEPVPTAETNPKKSIESNAAEEATTTSSVCPPPTSVIKKHVSIFSPVKDSKHSFTNKMPDEPSRSNTGICFPFTKYEDSVLGQFDDTAQFVSALAKVDTKISPLNTPVKSGGGADPTGPKDMDTVESNTTSFQQVFKKNKPEESQQNHEPATLGNGTDGIIAKECPHQSVLLRQTNENLETEIGKVTTGDIENSLPQKITEPPTITVTPPKTESSLRIIHRPNFASSTILSVKSWFPNAPVKMVTPRKTPRLVSNVSRSASPKGHDVSAGAKIAINDAFIIEQEERVRRWEMDHLYENTMRSGSGSPFKSANGSPTRKRIESPAKISPSKRSPKKQVSPCKILRRAELRKNPLVKESQCPSSADTPASCVTSNTESTVNQCVPGSASQTEIISLDAVSSRTSIEPVKSLTNPTQKLLTMLNGIVMKTMHPEPGVQCSSAEANAHEARVDPRSNLDLTYVSAKTQVEDKAVVVGHDQASGHPGSEPPRSTLEHEIAPSEAKVLDDIKSCTNFMKEKVCPKNATKEQVVTANPTDPAALPQILPTCTPLLSNDKSDPLSLEATLGLKEDIPASTFMGSAEATVLLPGWATVTSANGSQPSLLDHAKPSGEVKTHEERVKVIQKTNSTASVAIDPSKSTDFSGCHTNTQSGEHTKLGGSNGKTVPRPSKYASIISRVKQSTPLSKSVAALLNSSASSPLLKPRVTISTPVMQSTKKSNFKRSSALKPNTGNGAGNDLMNSIRSTFFQETNCAKADSSGARMTPKLNVHPRLIGQKSRSNLTSSSTNEVAVQGTPHSPDVTSSHKRSLLYHTTAETAVLDRGVSSKAKMERDCSGQWRLIEVDHSLKPFSLLRRFEESQENKTPPNARTDSLNSVAENNTTSSADVQEGAKPKPEFEPTQVEPHVLNGFSKSMCRVRPETPPESERAKLENQDSAKHSPKSQFLPRSCLRKTILLDSPLKMSTPTKWKNRSGESVECPKPDDKCVETKSEGTSRTELASSERLTSEKTSPRVPKDTDTEPGRASRDHTESRHSRHECSASCETSSRKSRSSKRDESPTPHQRRKSRSAYHNSPERSLPRKSEAVEPDKYRNEDKKSELSEVSSRKSRPKRDDSPTPRQRRKSRSVYHKSPQRSPVWQSEAMQPYKRRNEYKESSSISSKTSEGKSSSDRKSKSSSKSSDRSPKTSTLEPVGGKSKLDSVESSDRKSKIASSNSGNETPIVQITAQAPRPKTADSSNNSKKVSSSHARAATVAPSTPLEITIPSNRKINFGITSTTKPTEIVISMGKRPASFSPT